MGGGRITVVGLGPAGPDLVTAETLALIAAHDRRYLRTARHPSAGVVGAAAAFDEVYEASDSFDEVYETIAARLAEAAADGDLLYAVPGSPLVLERTVELLRAASGAAAGSSAATGPGGRESAAPSVALDVRAAEPRALPVPLQAAVAAGVALDVRPAMSFLDLAWARLGIDPVEEGVGLVDGHRFAVAAAGRAGPLLVAGCHSGRVLSEIKLAVEGGPRAVVLQRLGSPDEAVFEVEWAELDRSFGADHLTSLYIPELAEPVAAELARFEELVRVLRERCPWDREQTHASLRRHLLSEAHELLEALDARAAHPDSEPVAADDDLLEEELGDLLFQIGFHSRLAAERGAFTLADVARRIHDKLVSRHPHVFGDVEAADTSAVMANWEAIKRAEKNRASAMDGLPASLPALLLALAVQKRAASAGLDPLTGGPKKTAGPGASDPEGGGLEAACAEAADALARLGASGDESDLGAVLFAAVQAARLLPCDPESALRVEARRFEQQFRTAEARTRQL